MSRLLENYENRITLEFGDQSLNGAPYWHDGIDIVGETGSKWGALDYIKAHSGGKVIEKAYEPGGRGNYVTIEIAPNINTQYCHLQEAYVEIGDVVDQGVVIGYMGNTGNCTGAHLHFGVWMDGEWVNPEPFLEKDIIESEPVNPALDYYQLVDAAYCLVLGRRADPSGLSNYSTYMADGHSIEEVIEDLYMSDEYVNRWNNDIFTQLLVVQTYLILLHRLPESMDVVKAWQPHSLGDYINMYNSILDSDEYKGIY